jgi:hypothetical protein
LRLEGQGPVRSGDGRPERDPGSVDPRPRQRQIDRRALPDFQDAREVEMDETVEIFGKDT